MLRSFDRQPRLIGSTIVTALLLGISAINPFSQGTALAVPASTADVVTAACNNSFAPVKFPLDYNVIARPSANPIVPSSTFTVTFDVTVVASAAFLNGVYTALVGAGQALSAIPILEDVATIVPLTGATGPAVQAKIIGTRAAPAFVIPKPAAVPVTAGINIPLGTATGTYTADATGSVSFALQGNAWAPAIAATATAPAIPADTLPTGVTEFGWATAVAGPPAVPAKLTTTGLQTYTKTSLVNGLITPFLICMGGSWTVGPIVPPATTPTLTAPLVAPVGFANFTISNGPPITDPVSATTTTVAATTTTTVAGATTTTPTTATTVPSTTTASTTPQTTIPAAPITGTATYSSDCTNDATADHFILVYKITATALSPVASGGKITITDQEWQVTVPEALIATLKQLGLTQLLATSTGSLSATNASPALVESAPLEGTSPFPATGDLVLKLHPANTSFTATGGDVVVAFAGSTSSVDIFGTAIKQTCVPTGAKPALLTVKVQGPSVPTTTPTATTVKAVVLPAPAVASQGAIPKTGSNGSLMWVELFGGLLIIQLGIMLWSTGQGRRRRQAR